MKEDDNDYTINLYNPYMASNEMTIRMEKHTLQSPGDSQAVM